MKAAIQEMTDHSSDSISLLREQIRALNERLSSGKALRADQSKALRILRINLMHVLSSGASALRQLNESLKSLNTNPETAALVFDGNGVHSFSKSLLNFVEEARNSGKEIAISKSPWLIDPEEKNTGFFLRCSSKSGERWLACQISKLQQQGKKSAKTKAKETALNRAACFIDVSQLASLQKEMQAYANMQETIQAAISEIEFCLSRVDSGEILRLSQSEEDSYVPHTGDRPADLGAISSNIVLVVDDIAVNQKLMSMRLKKMGFECEFAANGQEALDKAILNDYALIFMDLDMPMMDGFIATQLIRKAELESGKHVPIIALTSHDQESDRERCLSAGMDEYISKGANYAQIQETMDACLRRSRRQEEKRLSIDDYEEELDLSSLSKQYSKEELNEIFEPFLSTTNTLMRCLRMSMDERNLRSIGHFAYSLKGPFASLGMLMTSKLTARLTDAAEESQWDEVNDYWDMLCRNCEAIRQQLEERASKA